MNESSLEGQIIKYMESYRYPLTMVQCDHLLTELGKKLSFEGRTDLMNSAKNLYEERIAKRTVSERQSHPVAVIGGCSGIGKTRALVSIAETVPQWSANDSHWNASIVISYNNGNPPICDRTLLGQNAEVVVTADKAFALRLLYFAFVADVSPKTNFQAFTRKFRAEENIFKVLSTDIAISAISQHCRRSTGLEDGILFVGVDEINYLLDNGDNEKKNREFLKATMVSFGGAMNSLDNTFVFGAVAGTTVLPLDKVFVESGYPTRKLPIGLLQYTECENIVDSYAYACENPELWKEWRLCRQFRTLLVDYSSLPRMGEKFLQEIEKRFDIGEGLLDIDYSEIHTILSSQLPSSTLDHDIKVRLIMSVMLSQQVNRGDIVYPDVSDKLTYGQLEEEGLIVLKATNGGSCVLQLPYCMFRKLLHSLSGTDMLVACLRKMCALVGCSDSSGCLSWQSFEDLCVNMEAVREMLLARTREEDKLVSVNEFYGISTPSLSSVDDLLEFSLRDTCSVSTAVDRFDGGLENMHHTIIDTDGISASTENTIFKNAPGALFDSFTTRCDDRNNVVLCCGQQKMYTVSAVRRDMIQNEATKVAEKVRCRYILVIMATSVEDNEENITPENCVIVTGKDLTSFFGTVFGGRIHILTESSKVNVNTANFGELRTVPGLGDTTIHRILESRQNHGPFSNWDDVTGRVRRIRSKVKEELEF